MNRVIVFCGLPGSGKTTLATEVSCQMNIFCLHKDAVKKRLHGYLNGMSLDDSRKIGFHSIRLLIALADDAMKNGTDIIIESTFNHPDNVEQFVKWVTEGRDVRVIVCRVDEEERKRRFVSRPRHEAYHGTERTFFEDIFDYGLMPGKKLLLDTAKPIGESVEKIIKFLN
ncbi:MAG: ATP-binding protein [Candidatus Moranbacteria bacterium]|nr:ATP-binding protein [Candidatus Moranbacteria bacterium]